RERSSSENFLKALQQAESGTTEAAPISGDYSFVEPKTTSKSLQMRILDPVHNPGWDVVVALHRDAGCFHTSAWAKVLRQTYNHHPFYLQFSRGRRLAALIPLMEVSSTFTGRRAIPQAERSNVSVAVDRNRQVIDDFYRLHVQTRRRHGLPPQPASFFLNIYEHLIKRGLGFIVLAQHGPRPIAAAIFFRFGKN